MRFINYYNNLHILTFPELRQVYVYDCGANALQSVLTYYGFDLREQEIMERAGTTEKSGSTPMGLKKVAEHFDIPYTEGQFTIEDLKNHIDNGWPTIMPIQAWPENPADIDYENEWEEGHWVIAIGHSSSGIIFEDPASVKRTFISYEDLPKRWHDMGDDGIELRNYGIVFKGIPKFKVNDVIVMESTNLKKNSITWSKPKLDDELGEYFENDYTKKYFAKKGLKFKDKDELKSFLLKGSMVTITKEELSSDYDNLTLDNFEDELKDKEYAKSYRSMEKELEKGSIELPTPVIIKFGDKYYGFAGNRRVNLAFSKNILLKIWLVKYK